jgi:hypothetical protein
MTTEATPAAPDASKKEALFEIFRAAVWGELVPGGRQDVQNAVEAGKKQGVTDSDLEWLGSLDGKSFRAYFGEKAISKDLENAMKTSDAFMEGMHYTPAFKAQGFYTPPKP